MARETYTGRIRRLMMERGEYPHPARFRAAARERSGRRAPADSIGRQMWNPGFPEPRWFGRAYWSDPSYVQSNYSSWSGAEFPPHALPLYSRQGAWLSVADDPPPPPQEYSGPEIMVAGADFKAGDPVTADAEGLAVPWGPWRILVGRAVWPARAGERLLVTLHSRGEIARLCRTIRAMDWPGRYRASAGEG